MVPLTAVQSSNSRIPKTYPSGLVAVFVGATAGIGEYSLVEFARSAPKSRIYFVGRSEASGARIKAECDKLNPEGSCTFIKADVSLMKNVDEVCKELKSKEKSVNLLFQSQGVLDFKNDTADGIQVAIALPLYSRTRFMVNLLPELSAGATTSGFARVVSVATGTKEGPVDINDLDVRHVGFSKARQVLATLITMSMQTLSTKAPDVTFIHGFPGPVKTSFGRDMTGPVMALVRGIAAVWMAFVHIPAKETGERHVFLSTSARWPAKQGGKEQGVRLADGVGVAVGVDGKQGSGCYSVDEHGESTNAKAMELLKKYADDGTQAKWWEHIEAKFVKITGSTSL